MSEFPRNPVNVHSSDKGAPQNKEPIPAKVVQASAGLEANLNAHAAAAQDIVNQAKDATKAAIEAESTQNTEGY